MPWTLEKALDDDLITVVERDDDFGHYALRIGILTPIVTIDLGRTLTSQTTKFRVSHAIHTPTQAAPYRASRQFAEYPAYALHRAVDGLTSYYREAIKAGHTPMDSWLVEN